MKPTRRKTLDRAAALKSSRVAKELLSAELLSPALVRAVALRLDELRFLDPREALAVAETLLESLPRLEPRRASLEALAWSVYGSVCKANALHDEAEIALAIAARMAPRSNVRLRADIARRLAYLRAEQRRAREARRLIGPAVEFAGRLGGLEFGRALVDRSAVLMGIGDFAAAAQDLEQAFALIPANGDRYYLAAVVNLARCRLELGSSPVELHEVVELTIAAARFIEPGSHPETRHRWLVGLLLGRLGRYTESLAALAQAHEELCGRGHDFDRALIILDIAELHIERGEPESAREVAISSFGILSALRSEPDAFRAVKTLYRAALELSLDLPTIRSVRKALLAARQ